MLTWFRVSGYDRPNFDQRHRIRDSRTKGKELAGLKETKFCLIVARRETKLFRRARHIDIERGPSDEFVIHLAGVFVELGDTLGRCNAAEATLTAQGHQVDHSACTF